MNIKTCSIPHCSAKIKARKLCNKHYKRLSIKDFLGLKSIPIKGTLEEKKLAFLKRVSSTPETGCLDWKRGKDRHGYGVIKMEGRQITAHRASYSLFIEPIPKGLQINHKCHRPGCVNPEHLYAGTPAQNTRDMIEANRKASVKGSLHGGSKLTEDIVMFIRKELKDGKKDVELMKQFSISKSCIYAVRTNKYWKHIEC